MSATTDPLLRLEAALPHLKGAVNQQHLGKALSAAVTACADVPQRLDRLKSLADTYALLPDYLGLRGADIKDATETILDLGERMESATQPEDLDAIVRDIKRLDASLNTLHRSAQMLTDAYARDHVAPLGALERLLRRLGRDQDANSIGQLRTIASSLPTAGRALPEKLKALQDARLALTSDLTRLASDPEVDAFLTGFATKGNVKLSLVTRKVLDWLGDKSALDQFIVQPLD
ncbi:hypothetical protein [Prosthecomicrobium sp. N25]|uniref:hypothetical protein n=1 Tax=Prosthecomicrobium sp. N25 TaxID=3129254 RepID=UPI003077120B